MNRLTLEILGSRFTIQSDEDPEHLESVAKYLQSKIDEVKAGYPAADALKVIILASLNITDNLIKLQGSGDGGEIQQITENLIFKLDQNLIDT